MSAHFPTSTVCVKGIQRLSKSIYSLQFGSGTNCCYRKVFGFLPHQRQTEYNLGSATGLIHCPFFCDMKHGSEPPLFLFRGKLWVSYACKVLMTQLINCYMNTSTTSPIGSFGLVNVWELITVRGTTLSYSISVISLHFLEKLYTTYCKRHYRCFFLGGVYLLIVNDSALSQVAMVVKFSESEIFANYLFNSYYLTSNALRNEDYFTC